jgi:hypothetical protein
MKFNIDITRDSWNSYPSGTLIFDHHEDGATFMLSDDQWKSFSLDNNRVSSFFIALSCDYFAIDFPLQEDDTWNLDNSKTIKIWGDEENIGFTVYEFDDCEEIGYKERNLTFKRSQFSDIPKILFVPRSIGCEEDSPRTEGFQEAVIQINGHKISEGMSMAIRVAVESFASSLLTEGIGDDEMGKALTSGYLGNIDKIRAVMYEK